MRSKSPGYELTNSSVEQHGKIKFKVSLEFAGLARKKKRSPRPEVFWKVTLLENLKRTTKKKTRDGVLLSKVAC